MVGDVVVVGDVDVIYVGVCVFVCVICCCWLWCCCVWEFVGCVVCDRVFFLVC